MMLTAKLPSVAVDSATTSPATPTSRRGRVWRRPVAVPTAGYSPGSSVDAEFAAIVAPLARKGRVWRSPVRTSAATRGGLLAGVLTASIIVAGAVSISRVDDGPAAPAAPLGALSSVADQVGAPVAWAQGITGHGVNVAVIDTGLAPVAAFSAPGKVVAGIDLSSEASDPSAALTDSYGHGTHIAGIIAGNLPGAFRGIAPDAGIVPVKVAGRDGSVAPGTIVAGIDWVIAHADQFDIRVLNLALEVPAGERGSDLLLDAVRRATAAGIVVVVAAGNEGAEAAGLSAPASDPDVIAVAGLEAGEDGLAVAEWSSTGDGLRNPDVAAPGAHIRSLRAPGSNADLEHPEGYVDDLLFLASGTSQSAAVVSGAAALLLQADPTAGPSEIKRLLSVSAQPVVGGVGARVGAGAIDVAAALAAVQGAPKALPSAVAWSGNAWSGNAWSGNAWSGNAWSGNAWSGNAWSGNAWSGNAWSGNAWSGNAWSGNAWSGNAWSGNAWS